jgi:TolB protein
MCGCLLMMRLAWRPGGGCSRSGCLRITRTSGTVLHAGSVVYDAAKRSYTISGSGENVWATADAFQFVWKKMEGDFTLTADISVLGQGGDPHKKAMLMARQSLDADSAYADVALHGVGLTSLQSRDAKGADTHEIQSNISAPKRLRLQKYGDEFTMWLAGEDGKFQFRGRLDAGAADGGVLCGAGSLRSQQGCGGDGGVQQVWRWSAISR